MAHPDRESFKRLRKLYLSDYFTLCSIVEFGDIFLTYEKAFPKHTGFVRRVHRDALKVLQEDSLCMVFTPKMESLLLHISKKVACIQRQFYNPDLDE